MTYRILLLTLSFLVPRVAHACGCPGMPTTQGELSRATAVFAGKVVDPGDENTPNHTATFAVTRVWKGTMPAKVQVRSGSGQNSCGFSFAPREVYLVYAFGPSNALWTDACTLTKGLMNARRDLQVLGAGRVVHATPGDDTPSKRWPFVAGLGVLALACLWVLRRRPPLNR